MKDTRTLVIEPCTLHGDHGGPHSGEFYTPASSGDLSAFRHFTEQQDHVIPKSRLPYLEEMARIHGWRVLVQGGVEDEMKHQAQEHESSDKK